MLFEKVTNAKETNSQNTHLLYHCRQKPADHLTLALETVFTREHNEKYLGHPKTLNLGRVAYFMT